MVYICPICDCKFGSEKDLEYHLEAHEAFHDNIPSMKNNKNIVSEIERYQGYLDNCGRGYQNKINNFNELDYVFSYDDPRWIRLSGELKAKANYECQICYEKSKDLVTHHRIPIKHDPSKAFDRDNLLVVCTKCHGKIHSEQRKALGNYNFNENSVHFPKYKVDSVPSERYCKICGKLMYSRYEICYDCFEDL